MAEAGGVISAAGTTPKQGVKEPSWSPQRRKELLGARFGRRMCQTVQRLSKKCRRIEANEHLGNIDCSSLRCNPAGNAREDRQEPETRPTASNPCPQRRK